MARRQYGACLGQTFTSTDLKNALALVESTPAVAKNLVAAKKAIERKVKDEGGVVYWIERVAEGSTDHYSIEDTREMGYY